MRRHDLRRTHTRGIARIRRAVQRLRPSTFFLAFFCLAAGFPGLNSFVGEFLIISGAFAAWPWVGAMGVWGVALGTAYIVWLYYRGGWAK